VKGRAGAGSHKQQVRHASLVHCTHAVQALRLHDLSKDCRHMGMHRSRTSFCPCRPPLWSADAIAKLAAEYQPKGVAVVAISSNSVQTHPQDGPDKMAEDAKKHGEQGNSRAVIPLEEGARRGRGAGL